MQLIVSKKCFRKLNLCWSWQHNNTEDTIIWLGVCIHHILCYWCTDTRLMILAFRRFIILVEGKSLKSAIRKRIREKETSEEGRQRKSFIQVCTSFYYRWKAFFSLSLKETEAWEGGENYIANQIMWNIPLVEEFRNNVASTKNNWNGKTADLYAVSYISYKSTSFIECSDVP